MNSKTNKAKLTFSKNLKQFFIAFYLNWLKTVFYCFLSKVLSILEINKNLKIKKGIGIAIKSKETSSKLAI